MYCCCKLVVILLFLSRTVSNSFRKSCTFFNSVSKSLSKALKKAYWKISLHGKKMKKILTTNRTLLSLLNAQIAFYNTKTPAIFEYSLNCSPIGWYKYTQTWELRTSSILDSQTPGTFIFQREPWSLTRWSYKLPQY